MWSVIASVMHMYVADMYKEIICDPRLLWAGSLKDGSPMPATYLGHGCRHGLEQCCGICEHLSPTHNLSQALITGLPAKLNSAHLRRQAGGQCLGQIIIGDKCSHMPQLSKGRSGDYVPGRSAAYENQTLRVESGHKMIKK